MPEQPAGANALRRIELVIDSRLEHAALLGAGVRAVCVAAGADERTAYQFETAVIEAVNNAILHAYEGRPGHRVHVTLACVDESLVAEVADSGRCMAQPPDADAARLGPRLGAHGRGWGIMRGWSDEVRYLRRGRRNVVRLTRRLTPASR